MIGLKAVLGYLICAIDYEVFLVIFKVKYITIYGCYLFIGYLDMSKAFEIKYFFYNIVIESQ